MKTSIFSVMIAVVAISATIQVLAGIPNGDLSNDGGESPGVLVVTNREGLVAITNDLAGTRDLDLSLFGSAPTNAAGETVYSVAVSNLAPNAPVSFSGLPAGYGTDSIVADTHGNVYLWLPDGDWSGIVTDIV